MSAEPVGDAVRDVGAAHARLVPDMLKDAGLAGGSRAVTVACALAVAPLRTGV